MNEIAIETVKNIWTLTQLMAPFLLLGFALAGIFSQFVTDDFIKKHLLKNNLSSVLKAVLIGIPLPLCSCGVIPVAASLRKQGASPGAVAAFTATTPQTGIDSIAASYSLMGGFFTIARLLADFCSGMLAGIFINLISVTKPADQANNSKKNVHFGNMDSCCQQNPKAYSSIPINWKKRIRNGLYEGFVALPHEIGNYIFIGILLGGLMMAVISEDTLRPLLGNSIVEYGVVTLFAIPLYVCATGSIPLALALIQIGFSPGAALVLLIAGPATNTTTITALFRIIGKCETFVYLSTLIIVAWIAGFIFDHTVSHEIVMNIEVQKNTPIGMFNKISAFILVMVLLYTLPLKRLIVNRVSNRFNT